MILNTYDFYGMIIFMNWVVRLHDKFETELDMQEKGIQDELLAHALLLEKFGPQLGRPYVDTLKGSNFPNMKELRFNFMKGVWRIAFAFDPRREALLLAAGNKAGVNEKLFYKKLIKKADDRFSEHLSNFCED